MIHLLGSGPAVLLLRVALVGLGLTTAYSQLSLASITTRNA